MKFDTLGLVAAVSLFALVSAGEQTCSQLTSGQHTNEEDKRKAQLCQLAELANVLNGMTATLHEAMVAVLSEQGTVLLLLISSAFENIPSDPKAFVFQASQWKTAVPTK